MGNTWAEYFGGIFVPVLFIHYFKKSAVTRDGHGMIYVDLLTTRSGGSLEIKEREIFSVCFPCTLNSWFQINILNHSSPSCRTPNSFSVKLIKWIIPLIKTSWRHHIVFMQLLSSCKRTRALIVESQIIANFRKEPMPFMFGSCCRLPWS